MADRDPMTHDTETDALDPLLLRVRETLQPLPDVSPRAIADVLAHVHGRSARRRGHRLLTMWGGLFSAAAVAALVLVALPRTTSTSARDDARSRVAAGGGRAVPSRETPRPETTMSTSPAPDVRATADGDVEAPVPVQFVLDARAAGDARTVAVVGDFNDWNVGAAPLTRLPGTDVWTVMQPVRPGRHVYAFVLDGERWIADPRAPRAPDADFGRPGSVLFVGAR